MNMQRGQALVEMVMGLLALMTFFSVFMMIADVCMVNLETLLTARTVAEQNAETATDDDGKQGDNIAYWHYTGIAEKEGNIVTQTSIPFGANDWPQLLDDVAADSDAPGEPYFKEQSNAYDSAGLRYDFISGLAADNKMFLDAADLVSGAADVSDYTRKLDMSTLVARMLEASSTNLEITPASFRSNRVYLPITRK